MRMFVSRLLAVQSTVIAGSLFALACNFAYGRYMIGYDWVSSITVGAVIGILIAAAIGLVDFMTYFAGRKKDFGIFNMMGIVAAVTIYNWNVQAHMNTSGWTWRGFMISVLIGFVCANAYTASCAAVKRIIR